MSDYRIKLEQYDEKLDIAVKHIAIRNKKINTPLKTLSSSIPSGMVEISATFDNIGLGKAYAGERYYDSIPRRCRPDQINVVVPSFRDTSITDKFLSDMENRIHPISDIIVVPRWSGVLSSTADKMLTDKLWSLTSRYIEETRRINGKLIMGNIPLNKSQKVVEQLLKKYLDEGITSFVLDYGRCKVLSKAHIPRMIEKELKEYSSDGDYLLYSMNMMKSHDYNGLMPADDFMTFANGFDIIGNYHMPGGGKTGKAKRFQPERWTYEKVDAPGNPDEFRRENEMMMYDETTKIRYGILKDGSVSELLAQKPGAKEYSDLNKQTTMQEFDFKGIVWN